MGFVTVNEWPSRERRDYRQHLEAGNVLFFSTNPFPLPNESQDFLRSLEFSGGAIHKNVAYRPKSDRVTGIEGSHPQYGRLVAVMRDYSRSAAAFLTQLLPDYARAWQLDYASFRPLEEENRDLPLNKRNDLLHTDAFPSRPTNGNLILRVFTNIHPTKTRNWIIADPFPVVAERFARPAGLEQIAARHHSASGRFRHAAATALHRFGFPVVPRSAYDRFMLRFHEYLKRNSEFQASATKYRFNFPPGSTWLTFTDVVPHAVSSGQHALEQTFIVDRSSLHNPEQAPAGVLERLCGKSLLT